MSLMAKTVIVKLTDDLDGGDADETVRFALDGRSFEIDLSTGNAARLREAMKPFLDRARPAGAQGEHRSRPSRPARTDGTLYSRLSDEEKARFRTWSHMPTARRISDTRVKSWVQAGKP
jgi:Lsr2